MQAGLQPESMSFFGEVLFLLAGLKACVLLSNLPPTWRVSFVNEVFLPSGVLEYAVPASSLSPSCSVALYSVGTRLETPAEYELSGDLVLVNTLHAEFELAKRALRLAFVTVEANAVQFAASASNTSGLVQELELAGALNYPVALSECNESAPMVEVRRS
ncbi:unnamed protein product [Phytophthora lilii]|uniref:Unnamed protein product n=1 Tax=Phytophthora lilii TaxID=2077276 RepID=A0A9W6TZV1_9STRA|nr:unnamed protein product [Phytophthora lilii]